MTYALINEAIESGKTITLKYGKITFEVGRNEFLYMSTYGASGYLLVKQEYAFTSKLYTAMKELAKDTKQEWNIS